jgi:hypothetical protein
MSRLKRSRPVQAMGGAEASKLAGSQLGSQRRQILGYARPQSAARSAAKRHVRPHLAFSGDGLSVPSKQRVAGSNPARRAPPGAPCQARPNQPGQDRIPILKDGSGSPTRSHRDRFLCGAGQSKCRRRGRRDPWERRRSAGGCRHPRAPIATSQATL